MKLLIAVSLLVGASVPVLAGGVDECLSQLSAYRNASSASWECASYVGYTFTTSRCTSYTTVTATEAQVRSTRVDSVTAVSTHVGEMTCLEIPGAELMTSSYNLGDLCGGHCD